jgi:hypothetical protein
MGPYCRFCGRRCFVHMPMETPTEAVKAYGDARILATCMTGQAFEKTKVGWCLDDINAAIDKKKGGEKP